MKRRHWKQRWDPKAPLIFVRRVRLGLPSCPVALPGQEVTPEIRAALGTSPQRQLVRLRKWWEGGFLAIKDWQPPGEDRRKKIAEYRRLLETGMSEAGARATVWPEPTVTAD